MEERRRLLTVFGGEGGWAPHSERPFEDGTNLYQKPTPKQDKVGGIHRLRMKADAGNPRFLVCGTEEVKKPRGRPTKIGIEKHFYIADSKINGHIE